MKARQSPVDVNCPDKNQKVEKEKRLLEESSSTETSVDINQTEGPSYSELLPEAFCDFNVDLVAWLPRETIRACCPESFRENYPRTTVIIDCAETFIQRPTNLKTRSETFSNYNSHNTAKYLVGISPHGQIMFISKAFGGRASDKFVVEKSGF
ncbi:unnamed protein product [Mytilus coruscus]|uniref:DDE Tnp4 domain-containing protein n=1 Tax=Mytilus coruscus TaxID=42192 RepID=A0A6J8ELP5_MYTCO|nr:unnamed protein product [Mytilus coruscus]